MQSLQRYFNLPVKDGETEEQYRERCALDAEQRGDIVKAQGVRTKKGWNKWGDLEKLQLLKTQFDKTQK
jgi:hypothetical protein